MLRTTVLTAIALFFTACESNPTSSTNDIRVAAARTFTEKYATSRLAGWNVRAHAAGRNCDVLLVNASLIMDDSMVEALHYGGGAYSVVDGGGVQRFCNASSFRGVAYKDSTERIWTYGDVTLDEAKTLKRCD